MKRTIWCVCLMGLFSLGVSAQSGTNSPYSQYGFGVLSDQTGSVGRGMSGLGVAYSAHDQVNHANPASYAAVDSLSLIFDVGLEGQITNFKEGGRRLNARNANFAYAVAALRLKRHLGMSIGVLPYSNIGYNYSTTEKLGRDNNTAAYSNTYTGSGGLHEVYLGLGWQPLKMVSVGVNAGYLWGNIQRSLTNYSGDYSNSLSKYYTADVNSYKLDLGVQLTAPLSKTDKLMLGVTYGLGHKIGGDPVCRVVSYNSQTSVADTTAYPRSGKLDLELPTTLGAGLMWYHGRSVKVGLDYSLQKWGSVAFPEYVSAGGVTDYSLQKDYFKNRHKVSLGSEICVDENGHRYLNRLRYRFGISYATPYLKINGQDGPKELSASIGLGFPFMDRQRRTSLFNISAQWVRQDAKQFITENTFRINIGLTFNERWFDKWKVM